MAEGTIQGPDSSLLLGWQRRINMAWQDSICQIIEALKSLTLTDHQLATTQQYLQSPLGGFPVPPGAPLATIIREVSSPKWAFGADSIPHVMDDLLVCCDPFDRSLAGCMRPHGMEVETIV